jgi:catechol 2,3-dioxygenase-like lactoylglutathione lyase family enzyme
VSAPTVAVQATRFLHVNLNTMTVATAAAWYASVLGLRVGMETVSPMDDPRGMGFEEPTKVNACFAFDHRGGRRALALELVQWLTPPTMDAGPSRYTAPGLQAIGFRIPPDTGLVDDKARQTSLKSVDGQTLVAGVVADPDGVRVELIESVDAQAPEFVYARINTTDVPQTLAFYESIGFTSRGPAQQAVWHVNGEDTPRDVEAQSLALPGGAEFALEITNVASEPTDTPRRTANTRGLFRMALAVDDVDAAVSAARAAGIDASQPAWVPLPGTPREGIFASFFLDPQGVMVEFVGVSEAAVEGK